MTLTGTPPWMLRPRTDAIVLVKLETFIFTGNVVVWKMTFVNILCVCACIHACVCNAELFNPTAKQVVVK